MWDDSLIGKKGFLIKPERQTKTEESKTRRMTYRQLAEWLANGNGQFTSLKDKTFVSSSLDYNNKLDNTELPKSYKIRRWGSDEWIEPTEEIYYYDCGGIR